MNNYCFYKQKIKNPFLHKDCLKRKERESQGGTIHDVGKQDVWGKRTKDVLNSEFQELQHPGNLGLNQFSLNMAKHIKSCKNVPDPITL